MGNDTEEQKLERQLVEAGWDISITPRHRKYLAKLTVARDRIDRLEATLSKVRQLADQWSDYRHDYYVPPEDGAAAEYVEAAVRNCGEDLLKLLEESK